MWKILNKLKCSRNDKVFIAVELWSFINLFTTVPIVFLYEKGILPGWLYIPLLLVSISWYLFYLIFNIDEKLK